MHIWVRPTLAYSPKLPWGRWWYSLSHAGFPQNFQTTAMCFPAGLSPHMNTYKFTHIYMYIFRYTVHVKPSIPLSLLYPLHFSQWNPPFLSHVSPGHHLRFQLRQHQRQLARAFEDGGQARLPRAPWCCTSYGFNVLCMRLNGIGS